jgi:hypothetical protein
MWFTERGTDRIARITVGGGGLRIQSAQRAVGRQDDALPTRDGTANESSAGFAGGASHVR